MDLATLYIYWIYAMLGISGLAIIWAIKECIFPGDKQLWAALAIGYNWHMNSGLTCSVCGQPNATQVTTIGTYCASCYTLYYTKRNR
jgi:hypothetical protein